jgi:GT2 family glycosyltransferase/glycosyltransferase involved in cell wall biosynthesis
MLEVQSNDNASDMADLAQRIQQQEKQIADFEQSTSWRLTMPLRWVARTAKRLLWQPLSANAVLAPVVKDYAEWVHQFDTHSAEVDANLVEQINSFAHLPLFSVLLPVNRAYIDELRNTIDSVCQQLYQHWEMCITIGAEASADVHALLKDYAQSESRIKIITGNATDIALLSNQALAKVSDRSDWIISLNSGICIAVKAMYVLATAINKHEIKQIIYADTDVRNTQGQRVEPHFKPDWNLDLHLSHNLIGYGGVYRTALVQLIEGYQAGSDEAMDFDLSLRCLERTKPEQILHLPYILFHASSPSDKASDAGVNALSAHFSRLNIEASAENIGHGYRIHYALPKVLPWVSLIIPTRNGVNLLRMCIESIKQKTNYANFEIIIVDNGSDEPATLDYFKSLAKQENIRILRIDAPFNYSALNNAAVQVARGELVALVNNDIEVISSDWLAEMVSHALRPDVGAVGARLWYPDDTLQHAGVILGLGGVAGHAFTGLARGQLGYQGRAGLAQNLSAVTAACLVVKKSIFEAVGGLNEQDLAVAFNDVDFCLRVQEAGYRNVWTPFADLYHHESASRGYEDTPEKQQRFGKEVAYMHQRWGLLLQADPAYSPNLTLQADDFSYAWPPRVPTLTTPIVSQPGQPPLSNRLAQLVEHKVCVAYFAENVHSSTFRYRAANMAAVLNEVEAVNGVQTCAACFFSSDLQHAAQIVKNADMLVISRARYDPGLAALVQKFQVQGKRVWFDLDDLVFDTQKIDLIISTAGQQATDAVLNYWYSVVGRMAQALRLCDGVITTHAYLADKIKLFSNLPVKIVPNFANAAQLTISEPLYQAKYKRQLTTASTQRERIKLGYFSGSSSHNGDLSLISHALERVMAADARIDLVLVGHLDIEQAFGARFGGYLKGHLANRVAVHPFVDFVALQALIADVDFNLVPLQVNDFTHCKSELKFVDAAIVGTLTIASPAFAYVEAIRHGDNGYLAEDDQWEAVMLQAIAIRDADFGKHRHMVVAANQDVHQLFTWQTQRNAILQALEIVNV